MRTKKTIGFTIYSLSAGGAERVMSTLANQLISDYNVVIISLEACLPFYHLDERIKLLNCDLVLSKGQSKLSALSNHAKIVKRLSNHFKNEAIDLVIGFTTSVNVLSIAAAKLNKTPIIISERNNPIVDPPNNYWKQLRNLLYKQCNGLVVQTHANKSYFSEIVPEERIKIIKNPIAPSLAKLRDTDGQTDQTLTILTVGRLDSNKSQDLLIKAFANLNDTDGWKLQIIGYGQKLKEYKDLTKDLNLESKVEFLGNVNNIHDYYNRASVFVFTSKSEGYPNALAEALYFGLPCISTDCPHGPSELIQNYTNGILIPVDDQSKLEVELSNLIHDKDLRSTYSAAAKQIENKLNIRIIINSWIELINKTL